MIELRGVGKQFPDSELPLLDGVDLTVAAGEVALLTGAVGAGKSTILAMLHGAAVADRGTVSVFGRDVSRLRTSSIARLRRRLGVVPDDLALMLERSAAANVALPLEIAGVPRAEIRCRVAAMLGRLGLALELDVPAARLSLGQRQRIALARALINDPEVLLLDQPTAHQHDAGVRELAALIAERAATGATALIASSDPRLLACAQHHGWAAWTLGAGALQPVEPIAEPDDVEIRFDNSGPAAPGTIELPNVLPFPTARRRVQGGIGGVE